jgi:predicted alpha/beta hydrolase family esterase
MTGSRRGPLTLLTVPGWTGSGPDHWMSLWERDNPRIVRVEQADWDRPDPAAWTAALEASVQRAAAAVILVAHSCGVSAVQRWAQPGERRVACALLVAPPNPEQPDAPAAVSCFGPMGGLALPFPGLVVASGNDPTCTLSRAEQFARSWGARFVDVGDAGHLNTASGHGPWPQGRKLLAGLIEARR